MEKMVIDNSGAPMDPNRDIAKIEDQLQKFTSDYQKMLNKITDFKEEEEWGRIKKIAKEISENLLKIQESMHGIVDGFGSIEEPELIESGVYSEFAQNLPELKKELFEKYNEQIDKCIASYKPNPSIH